MRSLILALAALSMLVALVIFPHVQAAGVPGRDSGVYMYFGWRILEGEVPYRDMWDHKGPLLYYLEAVGLWAGGGTAWGILALEVAAVFGAAAVGFAVMRRAFGHIPALFGSLMWLTSLAPLLEGGNFSEEYALPLQFGALYLFDWWQRRRTDGWAVLLIGLSLGLAFLLRPNLIGPGCAIGCLVLWEALVARRWMRLLRIVGLMAVGFVCPLAIVATWFWAQGSLAAAWDAVVVYNLAYSSVAATSRIDALMGGLATVTLAGIGIAGLAGYAGTIVYLRKGARGTGGPEHLLRLLLIALPTELILATLSGRPYAHYYITWLPSLALLAAFYASLVLQAAGRGRVAIESRRRGRLQVLLSLLPFTAIGVVTAVTPCLDRFTLQEKPARAEAMGAATEWVARATAQSDYVLVWGANTAINYLTRRESPSRFNYQYPLFTKGYQSGAMVDQFLEDIRQNKPPVIIDVSRDSRLLPPLDPRDRAAWRQQDSPYAELPEMETLYNYIESEYEAVQEIGSNRWIIYRTVPGL